MDSVTLRDVFTAMNGVTLTLPSRTLHRPRRTVTSTASLRAIPTVRRNLHAPVEIPFRALLNDQSAHTPSPERANTAMGVRLRGHATYVEAFKHGIRPIAADGSGVAVRDSAEPLGTSRGPRTLPSRERPALQHLTYIRIMRRVPCLTCKNAASSQLGVKGRRFKSCQPDREAAGRRPELRDQLRPSAFHARTMPAVFRRPPANLGGIFAAPVAPTRTVRNPPNTVQLR